MDDGISETTRKLLDRTLVWDSHACMPLRPADSTFLPQPARVRAAGVNLVSLNVACDFGPMDVGFPMLASFRSWIHGHSQEYVVAESVSDIEAAKRIDYAVELIGAEHVGLGLDYVFDQQELDDYLRKHQDVFPPEKGYATGIAMVEPERIPRIAEALLGRGYGEAAVQGILGHNNLRVARTVWRGSAPTSARVRPPSHGVAVS
jgi:microsomal dipeptidase-like Zn-dependent dipeptidase